jgi:hypothetical protein
MTMKKQTKKLSLNAETVRALDTKALADVAGGSLLSHPRTWGCVAFTQTR